MNKRQYDETVARIAGQLRAARYAESALSMTYENAGNPAPMNEQLGDAWNALHDAITALECELRAVELEGYGAAARRRLEARESALGQLVAQNID